MVDDLREAIARKLAWHRERRGTDAILLRQSSHELAGNLRFLRRRRHLFVFFCSSASFVLRLLRLLHDGREQRHRGLARTIRLSHTTSTVRCVG